MSSRHFLRPLLRWLGRLGAGLGLILGVGTVALWLLITASLPQLEGEITLEGLEGPVEIVRDGLGIPRIRAESELDAIFAEGFVHAQDRLFQMDFQRRIGAGRLAEILGEPGLRADRLFRTLGLYQAAAASFEVLAPETRAWLEAYAAGVNAFLATNDRPLPPEFLFLRHFDLEPWTPADSLVLIKLMAFQLDSNLWDEIAYAAVARRLTAEQLEALGPEGEGPLTYGGLTTAGLPHRPDFRLALELSFAAPAGSNTWAVDGTRSRRGAPLLANDPHLGLTAPGPFYLLRLEAPDLVLAGGTLPGVPGLTLGHNGRVAWGFTTPRIDTQDLFIETRAPGQPGHYLGADGPLPFTVRKEVIEVKGGDPVQLEVRTTRHGPVISGLYPALGGGGEAQVVALAWPALARDDTTLQALIKGNVAADRAGFVDALRDVVAPSQNISFADRAGIGLYTPGRIPIRRAGNGRVPAPGEGSHDWTGWIPFEDLPHVIGPEKGWIANANNRLVGPAYPYPLPGSWSDGYRAARIEEVLEARETHDLESFGALQGDVVSHRAREFVPYLLALDPGEPTLDPVLERLSRWDFEMRPEAPEPLVFSAWFRHFAALVYADELGPQFGSEGGGRLPILRAAAEGNSTFCDDRRTAEPEGCEGLVAEALRAALAALTQEFGGEPADWRWGDAHPAAMSHPLFRNIPVLGDLLGITIPVGGDGATVDVAHFPIAPDQPFATTHAAAYRGLYDLEDLDASRFVAATGQSGHPWSAHYDDLSRLWAEDRTVTIGPILPPGERRRVLSLHPGS